MPPAKSLGCFAAWDLSAGRRIVLDKFPAGLGRRGVGPAPDDQEIAAPRRGLRILYLTTQEIDLDLPLPRRTASSALLDALFDSGLRQGLPHDRAVRLRSR